MSHFGVIYILERWRAPNVEGAGVTYPYLLFPFLDGLGVSLQK